MTWIGLTVAGVVVLLLAERYDATALTRVAKPIASTGFLGFALEQGALDSTYGVLVLIALVLSWLGDVCLLSKAAHWFRAGLGAFLLAHIAYVAAFMTFGPAWHNVAVIAACMAVPAWRVRRWLSPHVPSAMRAPVHAYVIVITLMVGAALAAWQSGAPVGVAVGAGVFYLSDLSVARERFVAAGFINRLWGLPAYYAAQLMLAQTIASS